MVDVDVGTMKYFKIITLEPNPISNASYCNKSIQNFAHYKNVPLFFNVIFLMPQ